MATAKEQRNWLRSPIRDDVEFTSDQQKEIPQPPLTKGAEGLDEIIPLPTVHHGVIQKADIMAIIHDRVSHRKFKEESIRLEELSYLLWATQGVKSVKGNNYATMRMVPSAGARHPFETYVIVNRVEGMKPGIYRYLPLDHQLAYIYTPEDMEAKVTQASLGQKFSGNCAVNFVWSVVPYRGEWRYNTTSHKSMLLDAGHVCQNLYLACEAIGCGTCAIAAYKQEEFDTLLQLDGEEEFVVYLSPVGRV